MVLKRITFYIAFNVRNVANIMLATAKQPITKYNTYTALETSYNINVLSGDVPIPKGSRQLLIIADYVKVIFLMRHMSVS